MKEKLPELVDKIVTKMLSGRFLLTLVGAFVFAYLSLKGTLPAEVIAAILSTVFYAYFTKKESTKEDN